MVPVHGLTSLNTFYQTLILSCGPYDLPDVQSERGIDSFLLSSRVNLWNGVQTLHHRTVIISSLPRSKLLFKVEKMQSPYIINYQNTPNFMVKNNL